ncbi:MAG: hypothetical protein WCG47_00645, partial [Dermatophilaceae bacterium]
DVSMSTVPPRRLLGLATHGIAGKTTQFSAATMPFDDGRNRPLPQSSSLTRCLPASGTSNSRRNALEVCGVSGDVNCCHNR